ncbi:MAG: hypothetical protein HY847_01760 [Betaproteobacteria bacterium]|nr:hypothetical protein [Betaproteobacteria bacterium]
MSSFHAEPSLDKNWRAAALGLYLAAVWLLTHRYFGIRYDGVLYAVQAVARMDPAAFRNDLFFAFGSQDDYSLFSWPYAWLAHSIGLATASLLLLVFAQLAWATTAFAFARRWLFGNALWFGLALVYALPSDYGARGIFQYAESFLTARSWAEPLVLASLAAALADRKLLATGLALLAFLCHPIIALPNLLFLGFYYFRPGARWLIVIVLAATALTFMMPAMDAEWYEIVRQRSPWVLLSEWNAGELGQPLVWLSILWVGLRYAPSAAHRLLMAFILAGAFAMLLAALGSLSHNVLLIQSQPWRSEWLVKLVALLYLPGMFMQGWQRSATDRWLLLGLACAVLTSHAFGGPAAAVLAALVRPGRPDHVLPPLPRWFPIAGWSVLAVLIAESVLSAIQQTEFLLEWASHSFVVPTAAPNLDFAAIFQGTPAVILPAGLWLLLKSGKHSARLGATMVALSAVFLAVAASGWYRERDAYQAVVFSGRPPSVFTELVPSGATLYWENNLELAWFLLRRGNYASTVQTAGLVFSRETAIESSRRLMRLQEFGAQDAKFVGRQLRRAPAGQRPTLEKLIELCRDPILNFVVLDEKFEKLAIASWAHPVDGRIWYLYACSGTQQGSGAEVLPVGGKTPLSRIE